ncbi:MAG: glycosyltransferase family 4 protein [Candidatus Thorarchaeota archaeon]
MSIQAKKYLENFLEARNIKFLIEGLELDNYTLKGNEKKEDGVLKFAYVGFLDDIHKGVGVLLKAIEEFLDENKDLKIFFEIIGVGPLKSEVKKVEKKYPDLIRSMGYLTREELVDSFKRNDVFLFSSRKEPFGRVIIEALAANLIIICTRTIGSIEILRGKDFAFFLENLSVEQFKNKFKEIYNLWLTNPAYIKKLQGLASEYAIEKYSISKEIEAFTKFIENL